MTTKSKAEEQKQITIVTYRSHVMPKSADDYRILSAAGAPATKISLRLWELISDLALSDYEVVEVPLLEIRKHHFKKVIDLFLQEDAKRKAIVEGTVITLETNSGNVEKDNADLTAAQNEFVRFFRRFGCSHELMAQEIRGRRRLIIEYNLCDIQPELDLSGLSAIYEKRPVEFLLGFTKISLTPDVPVTAVGQSGGIPELGIRLNVSVQAGSEWRSLHTATCLYSQVGDIRGLIQLLYSLKN